MRGRVGAARSPGAHRGGQRLAREIAHSGRRGAKKCGAAGFEAGGTTKLQSMVPRAAEEQPCQSKPTGTARSTPPKRRAP